MADFRANMSQSLAHLEQQFQSVKPRLLDHTGKPFADKENDGMLLPHHRTFGSVFSTVNKSYYHKFDEALRHSQENALVMRRDAFIMGCLQERYLQIAGLGWHLEPEDQKSAVQKAVTDEMDRIIKNTHRWTAFVWQLCEAIWYGRYANQVNWKAIPINGQSRLAIIDHRPVNGDKIQYGYDGVPKIMVHHEEMSDLVRKGLAKKDDLELGGRAPQLALRDPRWRQRFVIHKHNCNDADYFDGEMAGGVHGVGVRSQIYWNFFLRDEMLGWAINHMKKIGVGGILVFYYEEGNESSRAAAENAAQDAGERYALAMPKPRGASKETDGVQFLPFSEAGVQALQGIVKEYFEQHIERLIIGQTLSSGTDATGLGSGVASLHASTKLKILKFDAKNLEDSLTSDLVAPCQQWNFPKTNFRIRFVFDVPDLNADAKVKAAGVAVQLGAKVKIDEFLSAAGLSKPADDDDVLDAVVLATAQAKLQLQVAEAQAKIQMESQITMAKEQAKIQMESQLTMAKEQAKMQEEAQQKQLQMQQQAAQGQQEQQDPNASQEQQQQEPAQQQQDPNVPQEQQQQQEQPQEQPPEEEEPTDKMELDDVIRALAGDDESEDSGDRFVPPKPGPMPPRMQALFAAQSSDHVETYASVHAPAGGININGKPFVGGQFIPSKDLAAASPEEKAMLAGHKAMAGERVPMMPSHHEEVPDESPPEPFHVEKLRSPGPDEPIIPESQWHHLLDVGKNGVGKFKPIKPEAQPYIFEAARKFIGLSAHDYVRAAGRAYQNERSARATNQDIVDGAACRMIDAFRGQRAGSLYATQKNQGVPKHVDDMSRALAKKAGKFIDNPGAILNSVNRSPVRKGMADMTAPMLGIDEATVKEKKKNMSDEQARAFDKEVAKKSKLQAVAVDLAGDAVRHLVTNGISMIPKMVSWLYNKNANYQDDATAISFAENGEMVTYAGPVDGPVVSDHDPVELLEDYLYRAILANHDGPIDTDTAAEIMESVEEHLPSLIEAAMQHEADQTPTPYASEPESKVIAHIAGPSGSGKTTLGERLAKMHPHIHVKDLDDFDDEATKSLYPGVRKNDYTDEMLAESARRRQKLLDSFVSSSQKPIVFVGHHTEGDHSLEIPTNNRVLLNTSAKESSRRALARNIRGNHGGDPKEMTPASMQKEISDLEQQGYFPAGPDEIISSVSSHPLVAGGTATAYDNGTVHHASGETPDGTQVEETVEKGPNSHFVRQTWKRNGWSKSYPVPLLARFAELMGQEVHVPLSALIPLFEAGQSDTPDDSREFHERSEESDIDAPLIVLDGPHGTRLIDGRHRIAKAMRHLCESLPVRVIDRLPSDYEVKQLSYAGDESEGDVPQGHIESPEPPKPVKPHI